VKSSWSTQSLQILRYYGSNRSFDIVLNNWSCDGRDVDVEEGGEEEGGLADLREEVQR